MGKTKKRILSIFLAMMTATTMLVALPAKALAVGEVCEIVETGVQYMTLYDALGAYNDGETIILLADISESTNINVYDTLTIDLAGFNLDLQSEDIFVGYTGDLTILDGGTVTVDWGIEAGGGKLTVEADIVSGRFGVIASAGASVIISGNISLPYGGTGISVWNDGTQVNMTGNITVASGYNIGVYGNSEVYVTGNLLSTGTFGSIAIDTGYNGYVELDGNIDTTFLAVFAYANSEVYVKGNIDAGGYGIVVFAQDSDITVDGYIKMIGTGEAECVSAYGESTVIVGGDVTAYGDYVTGVYAFAYTYDFASVSVGGKVDVAGQSCIGVNAQPNSSVTVTGNVMADGDNSIGVHATSDIDAMATVTVDGNVDVAGEASLGALAEFGGVVEVKGDITAEGIEAWGASAIYQGILTIGGSVTATGIYAIGVDAYVGGIINVDGNVVAIDSNGIGVQVQFGSEVTIEGTIVAPTYISFGYMEIDGVIYDPYTITAMDNDSSSLKDGYMQYSITYLDGNNNSYTDYVWVRLLLIEFPEDPTLPGTGDTRSLILGSSVLLLALMGAGALVLSRRKVRQS